MRKGFLLLSLLLVTVVPLPAFGAGPDPKSDEVFTATAAIPLPDSQKVAAFDISFVDPVISLYLLADRTNKAIDLVDTETNTLLTQLQASFAGTQSCGVSGAGPNDCVGPNGVLVVDHTEVWAGDGPVVSGGVVTTESTVKVIELFNQQLTHTISTGGQRRADELCYDSADDLILVANDAEGPPPVYPFVSFIATGGNTTFTPYTVVGKITMDGTNGAPKATNGIEQCQWSPKTGKFYLNIPEVNGPGDDSAPGAVLVISPQTMQIDKTFAIPHDKCAGPQGMALGPHNQILLGCNASTSSVIINQHSGAVIATLANEGGPDQVWFNEGDNHYFLAESSAATPQLGVVDAVSHHTDQSTPTGSSHAHSVAADSASNQVYVPIPAGATAGVCSANGVSDAQGCIAVFTTTTDDKNGHGP